MRRASSLSILLLAFALAGAIVFSQNTETAMTIVTMPLVVLTGFLFFLIQAGRN